MPYGEYWREHRRLFHQEFHPTATLRYRPQEVKGTHQLLRRLLNTPDDWMSHLRQYVFWTSLLLTVFTLMKYTFFQHGRRNQSRDRVWNGYSALR